MRPIQTIADDLHLDPDHLVAYGNDKAKLRLDALTGKRDGKLILVTAMSPSPAGEGKTTTSIGLCDALNVLGKKAAVALREPSMGPVFGMKGGGSGGGRAQVCPADQINLHFTGDFHAITAAHNLLAAAVDNHLHFGNALGLDVRRIHWNRVLDVNDRALRQVALGLGGTMGGIPREGRFDITAASEIMAILALATGLDDLRSRLASIVVGFDDQGNTVKASQLKVEDSLTVLLKDALLPNLVQTGEGNPAFIHAGPFANIAHGTNSVLATWMALDHAELVVQEAGFGSDLGGEKFLDIFCRVAGVVPACAVLVVTLRAIRYHAGIAASEINQPNAEAVRKGLSNPLAHARLMSAFGLPVVVAINQMANDTPEELEMALSAFREAGFAAHTNRVYAEGGAGGTDLAAAVLEASQRPASLHPVYSLDEPLAEKIDAIVKRVYGGKGVTFSKKASNQLKQYEQAGYRNSYVCMAKTQYSFSDDPALVGRPEAFEVNIREVNLLAGAGFVVPVSGDMMTMPGLAQEPNLERIKLLEDGSVRLF
ncbi:MAG: formate--tetrahydrofolate ligase [Vulcanimicrobiota bacterium]